MDPRRFEVGYDRWCRWLLGVLGMGPRHSGVTVDDREVAVRMGWAFHADLPRDRISSVEHDERKVWGWGVHGWSGSWLVNGSSTGVVRVVLDPPVPARTAFVPVELRELRVSIVEPERFVAEFAAGD
jgi:hypothetical protein